jgi:hypothetical protein
MTRPPLGHGYATPATCGGHLAAAVAFFIHAPSPA